MCLASDNNGLLPIFPSLSISTPSHSLFASASHTGEQGPCSPRVRMIPCREHCVQGTQPSFPVTCGVSRHSPGRQLLIATAVPQHFISTGGWSWRAGTSLGVVSTRAGLGSWQKREISALTNRTQGSKPDTPGG